MSVLSEWQDLNLRPPRPERGALPDCATLRFSYRTIAYYLIAIIYVAMGLRSYYQ